MVTLNRDSRDWIAQVFSAKAVERGAVVRRAVPWVEREIGREAFEREVRRRGYTLLEAGSQFIVICNRGPVRRIV
ncbi:MAG: N-(5'-phosphoribosyl)anthranilate isomerase [Rhodobacter sp.]|nr:N-(5'-phosphoribosyl)anthranilate isomerase [Rhodobacter sp.]